MKQTKFNIAKWMATFMVVIIICGIQSCKNEEFTGTPLITAVRLTNPAKADSTFTRSFPGKMIAIKGENLGGLQKVFFNDTEVSFNSNYNTNNYAIVTIPATLPLKGTNPDLPNQIRLVTSHGECTYNFQFLSPVPTITTFDYVMPATVGQDMKIIGSNFYEVDSVVFLNTQSQRVKVPTFTVNDKYNEISFTIPNGAQYDGRLVVYCVADSIGDIFLAAPVPVITSFSSDMPIIGDTVKVNGKYFNFIQKVVLNGLVELPPSAITVNHLKTQFSFIMPSALTAVGSIQVVCNTGTGTSPATFYPKANVVSDFDGIGYFSWGNNCDEVTASPTTIPYISTGKCRHIYGIPGANNYWWGNMILGASWTTNIPNTTPISNLVLRFSYYSAKLLTKGYFQVQMGNYWTVTYTFKPYLDANGNPMNPIVGKWYDIDIPLSNFGNETFLTYVDLRRRTGEIGFYYKNNTADKTVEVDSYFDNFRIIDITK
jgi:hypothetical protein